MNQKRTVNGLLDYMEAMNNEEEWEFETPSADFVPGIGFGATEQATRWAWIGRRTELMSGVEIHPKRPVGQPKKRAEFTNDTKRAFLLYSTVERIRSLNSIERQSKIKLPLLELISLTQRLFPTNGLFDKPTHENKMYASVKRGRKTLGIDEFWRGPEIESLFK